MKLADLPATFWVTRARHLEVWEEMQFARRAMHAAEEKANALVAMLAHERERYDALLEKYHALRLMGANVERKLEPLPIAKPDDVTMAIELAAGMDKGLARHLTRWAKQQQLDGASEHDIIQSVIHWPEREDWDADPKVARLSEKL